MPYSGASDPKLPDRIKKMSASKRKKWATVWNSSYSEHKDEGRAFAAANSAVKEIGSNSILFTSVKNFKKETIAN